MKKISDLTNNDVIHCPTEKEAEAILKLADEAGHPWTIKNNCWCYYKEKTCYCIITNTYTEIDWYKKEGYTIHKASEFLPERKFKVGDKVVPISKFITAGIESSNAWNRGKTQGFMYVTRVDIDKYVCWHNYNFGVGDHFLESDLIPYVEEFVLPAKWYIQVTPENIEILNEWRGSKIYSNDGYCTNGSVRHGKLGDWYDNCELKLIKKDYTEISFEAFKKYVLKSTDMEKEIIGYKCPQDLFDGKIKKDTIFIQDAYQNKDVYYPNTYESYGRSLYIHQLPKEIVETWEPVYKEDEFKVGNWVVVEKPCDTSGNKKGTIGKITEIENVCLEGFKGILCRIDNTYWEHTKGVRKATLQEIESHLIELAESKGFDYSKVFTALRDTQIGDKYGNLTASRKYSATNGEVGSNWVYTAETDTLYVYGYGLYVVYEQGKWATIAPKEKIVSVGGKFYVKIKDNKIYHSSSDITSFVKELVSLFSFDDKIDGYGAIVKDVVFSKTGCQNVETKLSDWKEVINECNKLNP